MSIGEDELGLPPRCKTCGDTTAADKTCVECKPYVEYVCERCARSRPKPVDIAVTPSLEVSVADDLPEYRLPKVDVTEVFGQRIEDTNGALCVVMRDDRGNDCFRMRLPSTFTRGDAVTIAEMHQRGLAQQVAAKQIARIVRGQS